MRISMAEIFWNSSKIKIPQNSATLLCEAQNSGRVQLQTIAKFTSKILNSLNFGSQKDPYFLLSLNPFFYINSYLITSQLLQM